MSIVTPARWSIKSKSLVLFAGYVLALGAVYLAFTVYLLRRETAAAHDRLQQTASILAAEVESHLQVGRQRLAAVAHLPGLVYGLPAISEARGQGHIAPWTTLHYLFFKSPLYTGGVFLVDRTGTVLWTEPPGMPWVGRDLAAHPVVADVLGRGGEAVSPGLAPGELLDRPHIIVAAAIETPQGERAGVLCGVIDVGTPAFAGILDSFSTDNGRFAAIIDQNGGVLAGTRARALERLPLATNGDGAPLLATAGVAGVPWRVVAGQPRETALADIRRMQWVLLGLGAALTCVLLGVGIPFVRGFVRSIAELTEGAEVIAGGDLSRPVSVGRRRDELSTLARTFERMREELARSRSTLEQQLVEREELIRLKEEFLANVSHELRTPLNVIIGYTDMLGDRLLGSEERHLLSRVRAESEHFLFLLSDLMTLSGVNTGRLALDVRRVTVPELLGRLTPLVEQLRRGRDVAAVWDCPPGLPDLHTDPLRLEQLLSNLITNAFKFTENGTVTIRARHDAKRERVVFEVADTGIGIPADEIPHIFDEFRQVDGSMSRSYGGIGLGLALVKKLAGLLHGDIDVASHPKRGSTFSVTIPVAHRA
jgi:signal transduction histidine kinase